MNRIEKKFKDLKRNNRKAFIAFITAGYPDLAATEKLILEFDRIGVDIVELGVPFSDPMADGPIIQEASQASLRKKTHLIDILNLVRKVRRKADLPVCLMTYYNPVFCYGEQRFVKRARECGVDGVIIPDLPPEEGSSIIRAAKKSGLDVICFVSPTSTRKRIKFISRVSTGFIYYVSLTGVTGPRKRLPSDLKKNILMIKRLNPRKPLCVGFGVSSSSQVKDIYKVADGVIVGSAIVKRIKDNIGAPDLVRRVSRFVSGLKSV